MTQPQPPQAWGCYRHPDRPTYIRCQHCGRPICGDCMISAAVGFQCPECVSRGARETRQNEGPYGGRRSVNPRTTTLVLMGLNIGVWVLILLTGGSGSSLANLLAISPDGFCLSLLDPSQWFPGATSPAQCAASGAGSWQAGVSSGAWWQPLTSVFTHTEPLHLAMNMLSLWFLGPPMEAALGRVRFLATYLLAGLAGSAAVMWLSDPQALTLGASGAVFGLIGSLVVVGLKVRADLQVAFTWLGINLVYSFLGPGISWQGHLGGLVGGALAAAIIVHAPRADRSRTQLLGLAGLAVVVLGATLLRAVQLA